MNQQEIIERLANESLEELKTLQDAARSLVKPEPDYASWIGGAVEVRYHEDDECLKVILDDYMADEEYPFVDGTGCGWRYCRPSPNR